MSVEPVRGEGDEQPRRERSVVAQSDLRKVRRVARALARQEQQLLDAIVQARASGETYRDIAKAAGTSHQRVWQLLRRQPPPAGGQPSP